MEPDEFNEVNVEITLHSGKQLQTYTDQFKTPEELERFMRSEAHKPCWLSIGDVCVNVFTVNAIQIVEEL